MRLISGGKYLNFSKSGAFLAIRTSRNTQVAANVPFVDLKSPREVGHHDQFHHRGPDNGELVDNIIVGAENLKFMS